MSRAEATELLIAAIARSDGTRASVARVLFDTRLRHSLVGPVGFDADGDPTNSPVTIYRVGAGALHGLVPDQTLTPAANLAR